MNTNVKYKILTSSSAQRLEVKVNEHINNGYECVGSHKVTTTLINIERAGSVHRHTNEYSQTVILK